MQLSQLRAFASKAACRLRWAATATETAAPRKAARLSLPLVSARRKTCAPADGVQLSSYASFTYWLKCLRRRASTDGAIALCFELAAASSLRFLLSSPSSKQPSFLPSSCFSSSSSSSSSLAFECLLGGQATGCRSRKRAMEAARLAPRLLKLAVALEHNRLAAQHAGVLANTQRCT